MTPTFLPRALFPPPASTHSLASSIKQYSAGLYNSLKPIANAYARAAGHRKVGLRYDDLIIEERLDVEKVRTTLEGGMRPVPSRWPRCPSPTNLAPN